jgi:uncharacterized protein
VRIELDQLEGTEGRFAHAYGAGELELEDERVRLHGVPEISGRLVRDGNKVLLTGHLSAIAQVDCDRCLGAVEVPVETDLKLRYVTVQDYESLPAAALEDEDLALSVFDGEAVDIDEIVREQVLLAVPLRTLCREDCKGFCPVCGADRNLKDCGCQTTETDARWAGLKELANRESGIVK